MDEFVETSEVFDGPTLAKNVRQALFGGRDVRDVFKVVRVLAVVIGNLVAIGPHAHGGAGGMAVAFELLLAILELRFLYLDEDIGRIGFVFIENADVGALLLAAKGHFVFQLHALYRIAQVVAQNHDVELSDCFLGRELDGLATHQAGDVRRGLFGRVLE